MAVEAVSMYAPGAGYGGVPEDDLERRRMEARRRLAEALKPQSIQHPTQGLAQMANAGLAAWDERSAGDEAKKNRAALADSMAKMWGAYGGAGGVGGGTGPGIPPAAAAPAAPAPVADSGPIDPAIAQRFGVGAVDVASDFGAQGQPTQYPAPPPPPVPTGLADAGDQMRQQPAPAGPTPLTAEMARILARDNAPPPQPAQPPQPIVAEAPPAPPQAAGRPAGMMKLGAELPTPTQAPPVEGVTTSVPPAIVEQAKQAAALSAGPDGRIDPVAFARTMQDKVAGSSLNGQVPAWGPRFGITTGAPAEWARFFTMVQQQESGHRQAPVNPDGSLQRFPTTPRGEQSYGPGQFKPGEYGLQTWADVNDPSKVQDAYIRVAQEGKIPAYFGSVQRPRETLQHGGWYTQTVAPKLNGEQPQQTAALPPQQAEQPKAQGLIQMAQSGNGMTPELFRQIAIQNPQMAQQLMMQEIQRRQAEPDKALSREHMRLQNETARRNLDVGAGEIKVNPVTGEYYNNKGVISGQGGGEDPQQAIYNKEFAKKAPELYQAAAKDHTAARELSRTLDDLKAIAPYAQTGFGAEQILTMRKAAAALGMSVDPKIAPTELFRALSQEGILNAAQKLKPLSNSDVAFVQKGLATMQSDPSSVPMITAGLGAIAKRSELAHELAMQQLKRGRQPDYVAIQNVVDEQLPSPIQAHFGGGQGRQQAPRQQSASAPQAPSPWDNVAFPGQSAPPPVAAQQQAPAAAPPPEAVAHLSKDASPLRRKQFDEVFGPGAAARALGGR